MRLVASGDGRVSLVRSLLAAGLAPDAIYLEDALTMIHQTDQEGQRGP